MADFTDKYSMGLQITVHLSSAHTPRDNYWPLTVLSVWTWMPMCAHTVVCGGRPAPVASCSANAHSFETVPTGLKCQSHPLHSI